MMYPRVQLDVPLANLFVMRDQQVPSHLVLIVGRMSKPQRRMEPDITSTILEMAGAKIVNRVKAPGTFEGGDFIPAGKIAMIGIGDRTNLNGASQVLRRGTNFEEVAVIHQPAHPLIPGDEPDPMINMHLDTYLNFPGKNIAVGCIPLLKRAKVEVYQRSSLGHYKRMSKAPNLYEYLMRLKQSDQFFPHKREFQELSIDVTSLQLQEITGGYGGIRCMTCVLNRKPSN